MSWLLHLHGVPRAVSDEAGERALAPREAALLAWLHFEGPTPRARLAALLWPGGSESQARANLRQALARLRRHADALWAEDERGLRLAAPVAAGSGSEPLLGSLVFDDAEELSSWLERRRGDALRSALRRQREALRALIDQRQWPAAMAASDALLAADAESEESWRLRMELLAASGDRAAAIAAWDECRLALRRAFGIAPSTATNELGRRILAGGEGEPVPPPAAAPSSIMAALPPALQRPPALVGREALLARMRQALALGHALVVAGTAGIGKSRLLAELAAATPGALVVEARPGDATAPGASLSRLLGLALQRYAPDLDAATRDAVHRLLPDRGPATFGHALEHHAALAAAARLLAACRARGLAFVVVDDLQFADEPSLQALQVIVGHWLATPPVERAAFAVGLRPDETGAQAKALIDQLLGSGQAERFELPLLEPPAIRGLVDALPAPTLGHGEREALAHALHAQVGGNPAFVLESLRSLWLAGIDRWRPGRPLPIPGTLIESVRQRLQRLGDEALQLARLLAVAGNDFSLALAGHALGRAPLALAPTLAALESAQLVHHQGFAHDLVAEAVQATLPEALRAALHRLVAAHLEALPGAPSAIAHHLSAAGDAVAAAPWHRRAGEAARSRWQMREASARFAAAAEGFEAADDAEAAWQAWFDAAEAFVSSGQHAQAEQALERGRARVRRVEQRIALDAVESVLHYNRLDFARAVAGGEALASAVAENVSRLSQRTLLTALRIVAAVAPMSDAPERLLALCESVRPHIDAGDREAMLLFQHAYSQTLNWLGYAPRAVAALEPSLRLLRGGAQTARLAQAHLSMARALYMAGRIRDAADACDDGLDQLARIDAAIASVTNTDLLYVRALMRLGCSHFRACRADLMEIFALHEAERRALPGEFTDVMAQLALACGRHDEAARWAARHPPITPVRPSTGLMHHWLLARMAVARGEDPAHALQEAQRYARSPAVTVATLKHRVMCALLLEGPYDEAAALAALLRERGLNGMRRTAEQAAARKALAERRVGAAVDHARAALALADAVDPGCDQAASVWLTAAEVLAAADVPEEAAAARAAGLDWLRRTAAAEFDDEAERAAFLDANPIHRALRQGR